MRVDGSPVFLFQPRRVTGTAPLFGEGRNKEDNKKMKKLCVFTLCLVLFLYGGIAIAGDYTRHNALEIRRTVGDNQEGRDSFRINDGTSSGNSMFRIDENGNVFILSSEGNITWALYREPIVLIDSYTDLSTWDNAGSGQSYFQMEAGKTYLVDPQAIYESGADPAGATGFASTVFSAVSAMLPLATATNNRLTTTVMWTTSGSLAGGSGSTEVQVWEAPSSGSTVFRGQGSTSQNMTAMVTSGSSVVTVSSTVGSFGIDAYGETGTWMLFYNSAVSAQMIDRDLP